MSYTITLIPGDGIGPEVVDAVQRVLDATQLKLDWREAQAGQTALETHGNSIGVDAGLPAMDW